MGCLESENKECLRPSSWGKIKHNQEEKRAILNVKEAVLVTFNMLPLILSEGHFSDGKEEVLDRNERGRIARNSDGKGDLGSDKNRKTEQKVLT